MSFSAFNLIADSSVNWTIKHTHTHTPKHTPPGSIGGRVTGPHPVTTPANQSAASRWQPSKGGAAAGESINILWLEHEDVFTLLRMSNDGIWKPKKKKERNPPDSTCFFPVLFPQFSHHGDRAAHMAIDPRTAACLFHNTCWGSGRRAAGFGF